MTTIGIDFGASQLRVAVEKEGAPVMLEHLASDGRIPPLFQFDCKRNGNNTQIVNILSLKRVLDFEQNITSQNLQRSSLDVLSKVIKAIWRQCQKETSEELANYVIAVPPCFSQRQRSAVWTAAQKAGIRRVKLVDDTLAVLLANRDDITGRGNVLVYSWGASAFSVSLFDQVDKRIQPIAQEGDANLGGDDIDAAISMKILQEIEEMLDGPVCEEWLNTDVLMNLLEETREAKRFLGEGKNYEVRLARIFDERASSFLQGQSIHLASDVYQKTISGMIAATMGLVEKVLETGKQCRPDIIFLNGGMTMITEVKEAIQNKLHLEVKRAKETHVAIGAVLYGEALAEAEWQKAERNKLDGSGFKETERHNGHTGRAVTSHKGTHEDEAEMWRQPNSRWADNFVPLLNKAEQYYQQGNMHKSIETFDKLFVELARFSSELYRRAAEEHMEKENIADAYSVLKTANRRDPSSHPVAVDFARACYALCTNIKSQEEMEGGIEIIAHGINAIEALAKEEGRYSTLLASLFHLRGYLFFNLDKFEEAEKAILQCIELDSSLEKYQQDLKKVRSALGTVRSRASSKRRRSHMKSQKGRRKRKGRR